MKKLLSYVFALFLVLSPMTMFAAEKDIVDTAVDNGNFTTLVSAVEKAGLVDTLKGDGPYTVFAPTDEAFNALLADLDITAEELLAREDLKDILLYHVVSGKVMSTDLTDGMEAETVNGATVTFDLSSGVKVNESTVTGADVEATNGVIHVIDKVMLPPTPEAKDDIVDIAVADDQFSILVSALKEAGLVDTLKGEGPFTVFAPTNKAFETLLADLGVSAEELLAREDLKDILLYHVVSGKVMSTDLTDGMMAKTVEGNNFKVDLTDGVKINDSTVTTADVEASNGVIHVIDAVLLPPAKDTTVPDTGLVTTLPYLGLGLAGMLSLVTLKKRK